MSRSKVTPREIENRMKAIAAMRLRASGKDWFEVAEKTDYTTWWTARSAVIRYMRQEERSRARELFDVDLFRTEEIIKAHWEKRDKPQNAMIILKTLERRAKYLGLDKPSKSEISGTDGGPIKSQVIDVSAITDDKLEEAIKRLEATKGSDDE